MSNAIYSLTRIFSQLQVSSSHSVVGPTKATLHFIFFSLKTSNLEKWPRSFNRSSFELFYHHSFVLLTVFLDSDLADEEGLEGARGVVPPQPLPIPVPQLEAVLLLPVLVLEVVRLPCVPVLVRHRLPC